MYEARKNKKDISRNIHSSEQKKKKVFFLANKRSGLILKKNLSTDFIDIHKPMQMKFSGNIDTQNWKDAIEYIDKKDDVYKKLNDATEDFEIEEKKQYIITPDDNRFSVVDDNKGKIEWNPHTKIGFGHEGENTKGAVSPAATLYHEMGHAEQWLGDKITYYELLTANKVKSPKLRGEKQEPILDLHNLANNEKPFNIKHQEPIRYTYSDAQIVNDTSEVVTEHDIINQYNVEPNDELNDDKFLIRHYISNYEGLSLKEAQIWSMVDAGKIQEMDDLRALEPLIKNNDNRKKYLSIKLKDNATAVPKFRLGEYKIFFEEKSNIDQYGTIKTLLESSGLLSVPTDASSVGHGT